MKKMLMAMSALIVLMSLFLAGCGDKEDGKITTEAGSTSTTSGTTVMTELTRTSESTSESKNEENLEDKITSALTELTTLLDD